MDVSNAADTLGIVVKQNRHPLQLAADYVLIEREGLTTQSGLYLPPDASDGKPVVRAKVLAVGPGDERPDGQRYAMPCKTGDSVLVMAGAGTKFSIDGQEYWIVYGMRKDVIGVIEDAP